MSGGGKKKKKSYYKKHLLANGSWKLRSVYQNKNKNVIFIVFL